MRNMENKVISREYVEKNYIHKDKLREHKKQLLKDISNMTTTTEIIKAKAVIDVINYYLEEEE